MPHRQFLGRDRASVKQNLFASHRPGSVCSNVQIIMYICLTQAVDQTQLDHPQAIDGQADNKYHLLQRIDHRQAGDRGQTGGRQGPATRRIGGRQACRYGGSKAGIQGARKGDRQAGRQAAVGLSGLPYSTIPPFNLFPPFPVPSVDVAGATNSTSTGHKTPRMQPEATPAPAPAARREVRFP